MPSCVCGRNHMSIVSGSREAMSTSELVRGSLNVTVLLAPMGMRGINLTHILSLSNNVQGSPNSISCAKTRDKHVYPFICRKAYSILLQGWWWHQDSIFNSQD